MTWKLAEAKNKLSEVVNRARDEGPQFLTRRNEEYVLLTKEEYLRLTGGKPSFLEVLRSAPNIDDLHVERARITVREIEL
jgi:prevent-host-death family protein